MEYGKLGAVARRDMEPCLSHQGKEPDRLKGDCLSAGIGSGDDQERKIFPQGDRDRHNALLIQQRMPAFPDTDPPLFIKDRTAAAHGKRQGASCENKIQVRESTVVCPDLLDVLSGLFA